MHLVLDSLSSISVLDWLVLVGYSKDDVIAMKSGSKVLKGLKGHKPPGLFKGFKTRRVREIFSCDFRTPPNVTGRQRIRKIVYRRKEFFSQKKRKTRKFQCFSYDAMHENDDFYHRGKKGGKFFRSCHGKIMKSDLFYCSMLLTLSTVSQISSF